MAKALPSDKPARDPLLDICHMFLGSRKIILDQDVLEVLRSAVVKPPKNLNIKALSRSNKCQAAKDALTGDENNLRKIATLGLTYMAEGHWKSGMNVLIRGWKRVGEFKDKDVRFMYLMKLCEGSMLEDKYRQAHAILKDLEEPEDPDKKLSYQLMACRIYARNKEVENALKMFNILIKDEEAKLIVRIWAILIADLQACGAYEAAKTTMEKLAEEKKEQEDRMAHHLLSDAVLSMDAYAERLKEKETEKVPLFSNPATIQKLIVGCGVFFFCLVLFTVLYWMEQRSLKKMRF